MDQNLQEGDGEGGNVGQAGTPPRSFYGEKVIVSHFYLQYPWVGAAVGIIISIFALVTDTIAAAQGSRSAYLAQHPVTKVCIVIAMAAACHFLAFGYRRHVVGSRRQLLEKPADLGLMGEEDEAKLPS